MGEGSKREQYCLLDSRPTFSHFPCFPLANWALLMLIPGGWVCVCSRTLWVSPTDSPVRLGVSPATSTPTGFYSQRCWGFIFPHWIPGLHSLSHSPVFPAGLSACKCGTAWSTSCWLTQSSSHCHAHPSYTSCRESSPPWLPISALPTGLVNVSSLTPRLSDFHTVRFSGSSGYFLFLNLLLSSFRLCEEAKCIYLCLHLGWKSQAFFSSPVWLDSFHVVDFYSDP